MIKPKEKKNINKISSYKIDSKSGKLSRMRFIYNSHYFLRTMQGEPYIQIENGVILINNERRSKTDDGIKIISTGQFPISELIFIDEGTHYRLNIGGQNIMLFKESLHVEELVAFLWRKEEFEFLVSDGVGKRITNVSKLIDKLVKRMMIPNAFKFVLEYKDI